ncbi:hypothetical protein GCM10027258_01420 [Amycolatopsis stemonae]
MITEAASATMATTAMMVPHGVPFLLTTEPRAAFTADPFFRVVPFAMAPAFSLWWLRTDSRPGQCRDHPSDHR